MTRALPTVAELVLQGPCLPSITQAVVVGGAVRSAVLALHQVRSATLSGKDAQGRPLEQQHMHAHYVPDCRGVDPLQITHVVVYAPTGLIASEVTALARLSYLPRFILGRQSAAGQTVGVALSGLGSPCELRGSQLLQRSTRFISRTPFVLPRHCKRGEEPQVQLLRELQLRRLPMPVQMQLMPEPAGLPPKQRLPWSSFVLHRHKDQQTRSFCGFRIELAEPVVGPLLLGYGCHYGLGQWIADES